MLVTCLAVFLLSRVGHGPDAARTLTFASLVVAFVVIILANRSSEHTIVGGLALRNAALWWVVGGTITSLGLVLLVAPARRLFHFAPVSAGDLALSLAAGLLSVAWFDLLKLGRRWARVRAAEVGRRHAAHPTGARGHA